MSSAEASSPKLIAGEPTGSVASIKDDNNDAGDRRLIWLTQPPSINYSNGGQPPAAANGTYSESLTRLQNGYLRAISALENRNEALQQKLDNAREAEKTCARLEQENDCLQTKLNKTQEELAGRKSECARLQTTFTTKNATIKEMNMKIIQIEEANRKLRDDLRMEKKRSGTTDSWRKTSANADGKRNMKPSANGVIDIHAYAAAMGWTNASVGGAAIKAEPAHKKRKYSESICGGADNPYVIE